MEKKIVISEHDETSLKFNGDFETNQFSKNIKDSLLKSLELNTKLTDEIKFMSGMSGRKYRYFRLHLFWRRINSVWWTVFK